MIHEVATLTIDPARTAGFEAAVTEARTQFLLSPDCLSFRLERVIEAPGTYHLVVGWTSVEAHTDTFRNSDAFQRWRELAGPFFTAPPQVIHTQKVI